MPFYPPDQLPPMRRKPSPPPSRRRTAAFVILAAWLGFVVALPLYGYLANAAAFLAIPFAAFVGGRLAHRPWRAGGPVLW